jgi:hypothetical protein
MLAVNTTLAIGGAPFGPTTPTYKSGYSANWNSKLRAAATADASRLHVSSVEFVSK